MLWHTARRGTKEEPTLPPHPSKGLENRIPGKNAPGKHCPPALTKASSFVLTEHIVSSSRWRDEPKIHAPSNLFHLRASLRQVFSLSHTQWLMRTKAARKENGKDVLLPKGSAWWRSRKCTLVSNPGPTTL
jgi:hypothetical protein